jgi:glycosyltransferase involved in cell wall biosynthesis
MNNKQKPLVSIAVCTYNGEKFLIEQLDSLLGQSYRNIEIIVVDDCSKDHTLNILKQYEEKNPNFKVYQNDQNLGYIKNFEKAISLCNGDYIALCDQDDIWDPSKIELQLAGIGSNALIYHDSEFIDDRGLSLDKKKSDILNMYRGESSVPFLFFNCVSGHACLFNRKLIPYCLPFPKEVFHDRWLAFTAANNGGIAYLNKTLVKYRQHENTDTNILKINKENRKPSTSGYQKMMKILNELSHFSNYPYLRQKDSIEKLYEAYLTWVNSYFCWSLAAYMISNYKLLFFIPKKGLLSNLNFIFKHFFGGKFKNDSSS